MSMENLMEEVKECVEHEYSRASDNYGPTNHSDHESCAIILEEFEEARSELNALSGELDSFWQAVKANDDNDAKQVLLKVIYMRAMLGACELIQVAAMAHKAMVTIQSREVESRC